MYRVARAQLICNKKFSRIAQAQLRLCVKFVKVRADLSELGAKVTSLQCSAQPMGKPRQTGAQGKARGNKHGLASVNIVGVKTERFYQMIIASL